MLALKSTRLSQAGATQIDVGNRFANRNWALIHVSGQMPKGSAKPSFSFLANTSISASESGININQSGSSSNSGLDFGANPLLQLGTSCGIVVFDNTSTGTFPLWLTASSSSASNGFYVDMNAHKARLLKSNVALILQSSNTISSNKSKCVVAWSYNGSTGRTRIALDGVLTSGTSAQTFTHANCNQQGYSTTSATGTTPSKVALLMVSPDECFDDDALVAASINPWQIFR